jgi:hypothetical protein
MAVDALQIQYRNEFVPLFEQRQSLLRQTVTTDTISQGGQYVFLVAGSDGEAVTRSTNGLIPSSADSETQYTVTLEEWHAKETKTQFNIMASQGNQRQIMYSAAIAKIHRKQDSQIITELGTATNDTGTAVVGSFDLFMKATVILQNNFVAWDGNMTLACTPAFFVRLLQAPEFSNALFVDGKPFKDGGAMWKDRPVVYNWMGTNIIVHPKLTGVGTSAEKCFLYHRNAIGHAAHMNAPDVSIGYNEENKYSFVTATMHMGAKLLQNSGVVVINHDGSAFTAP